MLSLASNGAAVEIHLRDGFSSPVDSDESVSRRPETDPGHTATLQVLIEDMIAEVESPGEHFDSAVTGVHHIQVVLS